MAMSQTQLETIMKRLVALSASLAVAAMFSTSAAFADDPIAMTVSSIDSITINNDDEDACEVIVSVTTAGGQEYQLPATASGTQLCLALEGKFLSGYVPFETNTLVQLFPEVAVDIQDITQGVDAVEPAPEPEPVPEPGA